jgi:hypothetical protein
VLPLAGGNSCGGALERVAWATLRRCSREDRAHREGFEAIVVYGKTFITVAAWAEVKWRATCLVVVMLELELTRARLPTQHAKAGAGEATTTARRVVELP